MKYFVVLFTVFFSCSLHAEGIPKVDLDPPTEVVSEEGSEKTSTPKEAMTREEKIDHLFEVYRAKDYKAAHTGFLSFALDQEPWAQYNLGLMYEEGWGVEKDDVQAFEWFERAALTGFAPAMAAVGMMYADGRGDQDVDYGRAYVWFKLALKQNQGYLNVSQTKHNMEASRNKMSRRDWLRAENRAAKWQVGQQVERLYPKSKFLEEQQRSVEEAKQKNEEDDISNILREGIQLPQTP